MDSPPSSVFDSSKSKKISSDENVAEKPLNRRRTIMTLKELKQAAQSLHKPNPGPSTRPDPITPASKEKVHSLPKSSRSKRKNQLPEKYQLLDDFFNGLDSSIRLLQKKGSSATFQNVSFKVESLTDRQFTYKHLAQLKFILPEAFEIRKVLVRDEGTSCLKPDLLVGLNVRRFEENEKGESGDGSLIMRKIFRSRLVDFSNAHPEGDEVPVESLPKPFDQPGEHMPNVRQDPEGRLNSTNSVPPPTLTLKPTMKLASSLSETCPTAAMSPLKYSVMLPSKQLFKTPTKDIKLAKSEGCYSSPAAPTQGTPAHLVSTPVKLMTATPSLRPPKRCNMTPESLQSPVKLARRASSSRSLKFDAGLEEGIDADTLDVLPQDLIESIREKERKDLIEHDPAISQAKWRQKMISKLPKFFDMFYFLLQSIKRSVFTKEELVHKILSSNLDMINKREVEENLALLQELVPDWIYEKTASSGDLLFCINKIHSPQSIRSRIAEAR